MKVFKIFIILLLISTNTLYAQDRGRQRSILEGMVPRSESCTPLSQKELDEINSSIQEMLASIYREKMEKYGLAIEPEESSNSRPTNNNWERKIFTNDFRLGSILENKYNAYNEIRYNQNWKNSPYGKMKPEEISEIINDYFKSIRSALKQNSIYRSNRFGQSCGEIGTILISIAAFEGLFMLAEAALPYAATAETYSTLSGFASMFAKETAVSTPIFMTRAGNGVRYIGNIIGGSFQLYSSGLITPLVEDLFGIFDDSNNSLVAQEDVNRALKHSFNLTTQIEEINNNTGLTPAQKQKRIDTRYKEAIIKIYALDYINTYLLYGEKPEKYLWAILDLTTLLQNRGSVTFEGDYGRTIDIDLPPRLIERNPEMQQSLEKIMHSIIYGFRIPAYGRWLKERVEERAIKNFENSEYRLNYKFD